MLWLPISSKHGFYPGNPNGKTSIQWGFYYAQEMVTKVSYAFSIKDLMHSYSLAKLQMALASETTFDLRTGFFF
jgi:hypothetical protein